MKQLNDKQSLTIRTLREYTTNAMSKTNKLKIVIYYIIY